MNHNCFFFISVLFEFSEKYKRYPNRVEQVKDWQILLDTRDSVMERLKVDNDILENDFIRSVDILLFG